MTYKWNFEILNRKVRSGRPRASIIKHNHRLKMTVLKGIRKRLLSTAKRNSFSRLTKSKRVKEKVFLSKTCGKHVFCGQQKFFFKTVTLSLWSSFIVEALGRSERTFLFYMPLITNLFPILFATQTGVFTFFCFKIPLVSHILLSFLF